MAFPCHNTRHRLISLLLLLHCHTYTTYIQDYGCWAKAYIHTYCAYIHTYIHTWMMEETSSSILYPLPLNLLLISVQYRRGDVWYLKVLNPSSPMATFVRSIANISEHKKANVFLLQRRCPHAEASFVVVIFHVEKPISWTPIVSHTPIRKVLKMQPNMMAMLKHQFPKRKLLKLLYIINHFCLMSRSPTKG